MQGGEFAYLLGFTSSDLHIQITNYQVTAVRNGSVIRFNFFFSSFSIRVWKLHLPRLTKTINIEAIVGTKKLTLEKLGALFEARLSMGNLKRKFMNLI